MNLQVLYEQVCSQHDGIADFRAKLLAFLPIASGAGIFLLFEKGGIPHDLAPHLVAIGLFGIAVTTGLFFYELRGIQKCNALIEAAAELEEELSYEFEGAFRSRPSDTWAVGATAAALIIYPAVAGAWAYMATLGSTSPTTIPVTSALISIAVAGVWAFTAWRVLKGGARAQELANVRRLNRKCFLAEDRRDRTMLEPILDEEFWIVRSDGVRQKKEEMLEGLASAVEERRVIRKELLEPCGNNSAVAMTLISYYRSGILIGDFWNTKVFIRDGGGWRCKVWQVARVA